MTQAPNYDAIWSSIARSPLQGAYIAEVYWLAANIVQRAEEVFATTKKPKTKTEGFIKVDPDLMSSLTMLVGEAVRIRAMITERGRNRNQSPAEHEIQVRRAGWIRNVLLKDVQLKTILEADVRNSLEHFDEHLDSVALRCYEGTIPRPTTVPLDVLVGRRRTFEQFPIGGIVPHVENLRVYIATEQVFVNAGKEISIRALRDEARRIVKRLQPLVPKDETNPEVRGSTVFVLRDDSFS